MNNNQNVSTRTGCIAGNVAAAVMCFFGVMILMMLSTPKARFYGRFESGNYGLVFFIGLLLLIGGIIIIRNNCRKMKEMDSFEKSRTAAEQMRGAGRANAGQPAYAVFYCPSCRQKMRVPVGKGRVEITCPCCRKKFEDFT